MRFNGSAAYVSTDDLTLAVNAAIMLQRPLLVKGEPGTGKTMLAVEVAKALGLPLLEWHIKSTTKAQQGLYEYDAVSRLRDSQLGDPRVHEIRNYIMRGMLWQAFTSETPIVLLIDEIDKADIEFPNDLLRELDRMEFFVYETKELVKAQQRPIVFITSNNEKELPDAFLRRCFFHYIRFPDKETMERIVEVHFPGLKRSLLREALEVFFEVREVPGLKKKPSTSELLDWLKLLLAEDISPEALRAKDRKIPVSIKEWLTLLEAMQKDVISPSIDEFYYLSRTTLVKDEQNFDKFDRAFGEYFKGIESVAGVELDVPLEWLLKQAELNLSPEEKAMIEAMGGWDKLMEALKKRLEEQKGRHQGGNKWIGTAGTSPFGAYGYNPEGVRIGQDGSRHRSAVKVWDQREYRNLDDSVELGTRNIKVALRRLRKFAREGAPEELDLDATIDRTARNAGVLDLSMRPERHNAVKVLMFLDIGGSMDDHVKLCEELFSAAKTEFKHLEYFYFHNCLYDTVWKDNRRRHSERTRTFDIMHKYGHDYKLVFVGDATMSPYEILQPGGSIEYSNDEAGAVWLKRMLDVYPRAVWLNPEPEEIWPYRQSIGILKEIMGGRMYPTTILGLERAMRALAK